MVQQNLENVQPGKMCSDTGCGKSETGAKPFESVADYGSPTLYILNRLQQIDGFANSFDHP